MNRDDLLRELELLPAWQIKAGFQMGVNTLQTPSHEISNEKSEKILDVSSPDISTNILASAQLIAQENSSPQPVIIEPVAVVSKQAVAVLVFVNMPKKENFYASEAGILLDNMLKAIHLKRGENLVIAFMSDEIERFEASAALVLGEQAAQLVIKTSEPFSALRGKVHQVHASNIIVSHSLAHLLAEPLYKREAWQDLKLLKSVLIGLQSGR